MVLKALFVVLIHLALVSGAAPGSTVSEKMQSLHRWDSHWYSDIATRGYVSTVPPVPRGEESNVTHFPGYPLMIRAVTVVTGATGKWPALIAAWLMAWALWFYVFALFQRWRVGALGQGLASLLMMGFPTAFFSVAAYSESLFLAAILGFVFWAGRPGPLSFGVAAIHGVAATATRIAAVVLAFAVPRVLNALAMLGALAFFAYCQAKFGMWNIYLVRQDMGWGNKTTFSALFSPSSYAPHFTHWLDYNEFGKGMNLVLLLVIIAIFGFLALGMKRGRALHHEGLRLLSIAVGLFALLIVSLHATGYHLVARYHYPIWFLLVLGATGVFSGKKTAGAPRPLLVAATAICAVAMIWLQCHFVRIFTEGGPVM